MGYEDPRNADPNKFLPNEVLLHTNEMEWRPWSEGIDYKLLHLNEETGIWTALYRMRKGTRMLKHLHHGPIEAFQLQGVVQIRGRSFGPGDFIHEPAGALHADVVVSEEVVQLATYFGALEFLDEDNNTLFYMDWEAVKREQANVYREPVSVSDAVPATE